jgi:uncharacterized membrane protein YeaQ/YmgE (transglycosylase-associated protein family)
VSSPLAMGFAGPGLARTDERSERDVGDRSMLILISIVFGMAAGWVAQLILGRGTNWGEALAAGLIGSFVGGLVASLLAGDGLEVRATGLIGSIAGAVVVLAIWGAVRGRAARGARR